MTIKRDCRHRLLRKPGSFLLLRHCFALFRRRLVFLATTGFLVSVLSFGVCHSLYAGGIKEPCVAGTFYPEDPGELSKMIDAFLEEANPETGPVGRVFALISPHAGYGYSGKVAGFGYKLIKAKEYKTVVILGTSHHYAFSGISVYPGGVFKTPLGGIPVDDEFTQKLLNKGPAVTFVPEAFQEEHSVEVQLPFLQKTLDNFKIVPVVIGDVSLSTCQKFAALLKESINTRNDVLLVVSTDMYHGYDYEEADKTDNLTLAAIKNMDAQALYYGIRDEKMQLCGGFGVVTALILAKSMGYDKAVLLKHTNSAEVTNNMKKGIWTVGYSSWAIGASMGSSVNGGQSRTSGASLGPSANPGGEAMFNKGQRKRLLEIARAAIEAYLKNGKVLEITETDPALAKTTGAFVTLNEHGDLRGCIGSLLGTEPLYLTVRDMAVEAATGDSRFNPVKLPDLKNIEIEVSVLSPMQKIDDPGLIKLGVHGVLVRQGYKSGVFLPQVATETGWSKDDFMSNLCVHKAGLAPDAWKDRSTEIYIFTAEVFSEKEMSGG
ncbi:MAG: AmmeMemoRadiSam system protein B [Candidatus Omnitrophota bacterium]